ncbi:MAG: signal peptidase II [Dehalococcoidales bacterium]|nr:signal peptidase II [Dehalococcoidales bacterium]
MIVDQAAKLWVQANLPLRADLPLFGGLRLTHYANRGAVGGLGRDLPWVVPGLILAGLLLIALLLVAYRLYRTHFGGSWRAQWFLVLSVAPLLCTSIDRIRLGYVLDFLHIPGLPVFNIGDLLPNFAVAFLLLECVAVVQRRKTLYGRTSGGGLYERQEGRPQEEYRRIRTVG